MPKPTIKLKQPLSGGALGDAVETLTFNSITAGDYRYQDEYGYHGQIQALISSLTGIDVAVIKKLRGPDYMAAKANVEAILKADSDASKEMSLPDGTGFPLADPIVVGENGRTITSLTFRDYTTAEDYRAFDLFGDGGRTLFLLSSLTGMDMVVIEKMSGRDYLVAVRKINELLDNDNSFDAPAKTEEEKPLDPKEQG